MYKNTEQTQIIKTQRIIWRCNWCWFWEVDDKKKLSNKKRGFLNLFFYIKLNFFDFFNVSSKCLISFTKLLTVLHACRTVAWLFPPLCSYIRKWRFVNCFRSTWQVVLLNNISFSSLDLNESILKSK